MTDSIITPDMICACARDAFAQGAGRNDHNMNPGSAAITDWQDEWDRCMVEKVQDQRRATGAVMQQLEVSPP